MFRRIRSGLTILFLTTLAPSSGDCQWYVNPQANAGSNPGNVALNGMLTGANGLISGNGITPGGGVLPTVAATSGTDATSPDTGAAGAGGYSFTADPVSAYESAATNGMANMIRAEGDYNRKTAKALTEYEVARAAYMENQNHIFNLRRTFARAQLQARADDREEATAKRIRTEAFLAAHRPQPLGNRHIDPSTGQMRWPSALMHPAFDEDRQRLEDLFRTHSHSGSDSDVSTDIKKQVHEAQTKLHSHVQDLDLQDYSDARQFLDRMAVTAQKKYY